MKTRVLQRVCFAKSKSTDHTQNDSLLRYTRWLRIHSGVPIIEISLSACRSSHAQFGDSSTWNLLSRKTSRLFRHVQDTPLGSGFNHLNASEKGSRLWNGEINYLNVCSANQLTAITCGIMGDGWVRLWKGSKSDERGMTNAPVQ